MSRVRAVIRSYPLLFVTLGVGLVGLVLLTTPASGFAEWVVGVYALFIAAWEAVGMVRQLLRGHVGLDILAVTAITAAVLVGENWAALVVVLMLTGGTALEHYAEHRSQRELTALLRRAPQNAVRILHSASAEVVTEEVAVHEVRVGDLLLIRPGALVPVDSVLLTEHAVFDESSLTGESLPVERDAGERVASGVTNGATAITMRAVSAAADSEYQQIVRLVQQAAESKARVVRLADRYAVPFTLLSLFIAAIAWAVSGEAVRFAEVLVVATPCPLLIAAPVAFLGGMSRAARFGLIVKGGGTLEQLSRARSVAFDKTGTLTSGRPVLERVVTAPGFSEDQILQFAASAEVYSSHVLSDSVVLAAKQRGVTLLEAVFVEEVATDGVLAELKLHDQTDTVAVRVGKPSWLGDYVSNLQLVKLDTGELAIYVAVDKRFAGAIVMRDQVREEAGQALNELRQLGIDRMVMVTGDVGRTAELVAAKLDIVEVHAECRPSDKVRIVSEIQPRPLIMVGDGLNDAPVLAASDIGFAMGARGATAASESADIVNRFDNLNVLPKAIHIARDTVRIALQSIWLGILISIGLMLLAAFGFLPALIGAWMQELVDLVAIFGALRAIGPRSERRRAPALTLASGVNIRSAGR